MPKAKPTPKSEIIHDWNAVSPRAKPPHAFDVLDETLRDGVQSPSVTDPELEDKLALVDLMESLGVGAVNIGLPGAGRLAFDDVVALAKFIKKNKLKIEPNCAARTVTQDLAPI